MTISEKTQTLSAITSDGFLLSSVRSLVPNSEIPEGMRSIRIEKALGRTASAFFGLSQTLKGFAQVTDFVTKAMLDYSSKRDIDKLDLSITSIAIALVGLPLLRIDEIICIRQELRQTKQIQNVNPSLNFDLGLWLAINMLSSLDGVKRFRNNQDLIDLSKKASTSSGWYERHKDSTHIPNRVKMLALGMAGLCHKLNIDPSSLEIASPGTTDDCVPFSTNLN